MNAALAGRRVLVTGARGFLGRALVAELRAAGAVVTATTRAPEVADCVSCDLGDLAAVRALMSAAAPDSVVHLSSQADGRRDLALVPTTLHSETVAAVNVLTAATEQRLRRIILPASLEEPAPGAAPLSPYGAAKAATHLYARMFHAVYKTPVVMVRVFMAYGPGQAQWKLVPATIASLQRGEPPRVESPDRRADWVYVDDVTAALVATLLAGPEVDGRILDVGSGSLTTIGDLVSQLCALVAPGLRPEFGVGRPRGDVLVREADLATAAALTGWRPRVTLPEGLRLTLAGLQQIPVPPR
jgi:nucleoside-diphosphate-sugar epimerase